jgi:predicted DNA-binding transcriptional regulator YafY
MSRDTEMSRDAGSKVSGSAPDTAARLLHLLSLLQSRRDWVGDELAGRLGVTTRTIRRDVDRLRGLGYPVRAAPGVAGGYRLGAGGALPPLLLDDDEAVAVAVGLRTAAGGTVAGMEETSVRALAKLEQVLPPRLRERVAAVQGSTVPLLAGGPTVDAGALATIAAACRDSVGLHFEYVRDGAESSSTLAPPTRARRTVEPHRLVHTGRRWYLVARDPDRAVAGGIDHPLHPQNPDQHSHPDQHSLPDQHSHREHDGWRTFRVDRMVDVRSTDRRFIPRDPPDAATFVSTSVSSAPYRHQARVRMHAPAAVVAARVPPTVGLVERVDDNTCVLTTGSNSLDSLAVHLAAIGVDFTVLAPPELAERVHTLGERLLRAGMT